MSSAAGSRPATTAGTSRRPRTRGRLAAVLVADAVEQVAVCDAGRGEEDVVAGNEPVDLQDLVEVVAGLERAPALILVARPQPAEELAAHALDRGGGQDALGRAAYAPEQIDAGVLGDREQRSRHVSVGDKADS